MRRLAVGVAVSVLVAGLALSACGAVVASAFGGTTGSPTSGPGGSGPGGATSSALRLAPATGTPAVPASWELLDERAAATCPGLAWTVVAAIGRVESDSGRSTLPGVASGANAFGAEGPMQFEPTTFTAYAVVGPGGASPPSPYDPVDAVYTAARLLCADGAGSVGGLYRAVFAYDHSAAYVDTVLVLAAALGADPALGSRPAAALAYAAGQLGVPYRWGGETPGAGFDCSGLVQAAYRAAGVLLPRVAQTQFDAGPRVPAGSAWAPGDLVFFGTSPRAVTHVGIYLGAGEMLDAPDTGEVVRVERTPTAAGLRWGGDVVVGVTRPSA